MPFFFVKQVFFGDVGCCPNSRLGLLRAWVNVNFTHFIQLSIQPENKWTFWLEYLKHFAMYTKLILGAQKGLPCMRTAIYCLVISLLMTR